MGQGLAPLLQRWQRLTARQRALTALLGGFLLLGAVDLIALRPLRRRVSQLRSQAREIEQRLIQAMVASAQAEAVNETYAQYAPYVQPSAGPEADLAALSSEVEGAARALGVQLINLRQEPTSGERRVVSVNLETEATATQVAELLDRLARSPQLLRITEMSLRLAEGRALRASFVISKLVAVP